MKTILGSRPVLWFLFLFNLTVAAIAPFAVDGAQGIATAVGMGVVSLGAGSALLKARKQQPQPQPQTPQGGWEA